MIRDLQLIKSPELLFEKKCVIWGAGKNGKKLYQDLLMLGIQEEDIILCDSNAEKLNEIWNDKILQTDHMLQKISVNRNDYMIIISVESMIFQDEIIDLLKELALFDMDIYTLYGVRYAMFSEKYKRGLNVSRYDLGLADYSNDEMRKMRHTIDKLAYLVMASSLNLNQMILLYVSGKTGSTTITHSLESYGIYNLRAYTLRDLDYAKEILKSRHGKVITVIRNPLEWRMSRLWQSLSYEHFEYPDLDLYGHQDVYWNDFKEQEYRWFDREIRGSLGIDVFQYPFNREQGYAVIEKDGIEVLIMVTEKISKLEKVIGRFVGIEDFKLLPQNTGNKREYRFAYEEYKKEFKIPESIFMSICEDEEVRHFYTDEDLLNFREKWKMNIVKDEGTDVKIGI